MLEENVFLLLKEKRAYQLQKKLYNFVNDRFIISKIQNKEDIVYLVDKEIQELTNEFSHTFKIDTEYEYSNMLTIQNCFESIISKSLHNNFILSYEKEDAYLSLVILNTNNKINENNVLIENTFDNYNNKTINKQNNFNNLETMLKVDDIINLISNIKLKSNEYSSNNLNTNNTEKIMSEISKIILKFKNNLYFNKSANEKLSSIKVFVHSLNLLLGFTNNINSLNNSFNTKTLIKMLCYCIIKGNISRIYSNIYFIKTFKMISTMSTEDNYNLNLLWLSVKKLKVMFSKQKELVNITNVDIANSINKKPYLSTDLHMNFEDDISNKNNNNNNNNNNNEDINSIFNFNNKDNNKIEVNNISSEDNINSKFSLNYLDDSNENINNNFNNKDTTSAILNYIENKSKRKSIDALEVAKNNQSLLTCNAKSLISKHFTKEFGKLNRDDVKCMHNDFKIILKLIESFKIDISMSVNDSKNSNNTN